MEYYEDEVLEDDALDLIHGNMESPTEALNASCFSYSKKLIHTYLDVWHVGNEDPSVDN